MTGSDDFRHTVVQAAIPLIGEYETLTTTRIAEAAGVAESDLVAVFPDKEAVLQACVATMTERLTAAMDPATEIRALETIGVDQPLEARLIEVLGVVDGYYRRVRRDMAAFEQAAGPSTTRPSASGELRSLGNQPGLRVALVRLLEPDRGTLRLPPEALAEVFLTAADAGSRVANEERPPLPADQVVTLFLHGALIAGQ